MRVSEMGVIAVEEALVSASETWLLSSSDQGAELPGQPVAGRGMDVHHPSIFPPRGDRPRRLPPGEYGDAASDRHLLTATASAGVSGMGVSSPCRERTP